MATKYITYTYPLLLPLCVLTADYIWKKGSSLPLKGMLLCNILFYGALTFAASKVTKLAPGVFPNPGNLFYFMLIYTLCMVVLAFHKYKGKSSQEVFSTVVMLTIAFHCCSLDLLAKPLMEDVTGKTAAQFINALVPADMPIYIRGGGYPTSGVFYTGREMVMLVPAGGGGSPSNPGKTAGPPRTSCPGPPMVRSGNSRGRPWCWWTPRHGN